LEAVTPNYFIICLQLRTKMQTLFILSIPETRLFSYIEFKKSSNAKIKQYIIHLLRAVPDGLTCREISEVSGIEVQSLTNPLKELQTDFTIKVTGIKKSSVSNRMVQVYSINANI